MKRDECCVWVLGSRFLVSCVYRTVWCTCALGWYSKYNQLSTIETSTVTPSMRGIHYIMDFSAMENEAHLRPWPKNLRA